MDKEDDIHVTRDLPLSDRGSDQMDQTRRHHGTRSRLTGSRQKHTGRPVCSHGTSRVFLTGSRQLPSAEFEHLPKY